VPPNTATTRTSQRTTAPDEIDTYDPTTERLDVDTYLSSAGSYLIYLFHIAAYEFAAGRLPAQSRVLDYGCGTGYGSFHLAESACDVVGVDVSEAAVSYAAGRYHSPDLAFEAIRPVEEQRLPFDDECFDVVVSFQVIEHVPSVDAYLAEAARVLRPGGTFICATPDRETRLFGRQRPWNRWHLEEFDQQGLADAVGRHLDVDEVMGMTAPAGVVDLELRRARMVRVVTLPFTFPGAPERWRVAGLEGLRSAGAFAGRLRGKLRGPTTPAPAPVATDASAYSFGPEDVVIAPGANPSTNVVLTATKRARG
jgi:SAM-dependent methyltransferase